MRPILLLFIVSIACASPPIHEVMDHNDARASALNDYYNNSIAENNTIMLSFGDYDQELSLSASVDVAGLNLLLDNMTHPTADLALLIARGYDQEHLTSRPSEGYPDFTCDADWFYGGMQYAWRCDFDEDDCTEFENSTSVSYDLEFTFTFKDTSVVVPSSSTRILIPEDILEAMEDSSGQDNLTITVAGDVIFNYEINDRGFDGFDCVSSYYNVSGSVPIFLNRSFVVAGTHKLFFLLSPILREQWFRNNKFNTIILSQSPLYHAAIYLDGNSTKNITIREFYNATNQYELQLILSNKTNETFEYTNLTNPISLQYQNHSFFFIYGFNYSYSALGKHNLSILVNDSFLGFAQYSDVITSKMLSYNGTYTEEGTLANETITRKSSSFARQTITPIEIGLGFVALILFLSFLNFWVKN
ncbi:hypothetical protein KKB44_02100 [Candidatus Micrarchaeota archaeon]|nr:hypothetical protein [Candidatus Micrarchaeota archaeon]